MLSSTIIHAYDHKTYRQDGRVVWGDGLWAPVTSVAWVPFPLLLFCDIPIQSIVSFILNTCKLYLLPLSILLTTKHTGRMVEKYEALVYGHQPVRWRGLASNSFRFVDIPIQSVASFILNTCKCYLLPSSMLLTTKHTGRTAELYGVLVLGTSHLGGVGSSPTPIILLTFLKKVMFPLFWTPPHAVIYYYRCYWPQNIQTGWPCGLRFWLKAPVTSVAWVWVPFLIFHQHCYTKYCIIYIEHLEMVPFTIIYAIDLKK